MFRVKLVFPIDGRAATMMRSEGWNPEVIASSSSNPVGTPVTRPRRSWRFSMAWKLWCTRVLSGTNPLRTRSSAISKIARSASSSSRSASCSPS